MLQALPDDWLATYKFCVVLTLYVVMLFKPNICEWAEASIEICGSLIGQGVSSKEPAIFPYPCTGDAHVMTMQMPGDRLGIAW